jgi:putative tryptophan/tyrosine transport system substrate-binding protein
VITRRRLLVGFALGVLVARGRGHAQPTKPARIGRLSPLSAEADDSNLAAFRRGLRELGWLEGQHYAIETRFADGKPDRLAALAAELVHQRVDLILIGSTPGTLAVKKATTTIPIVMVTTGDPVDGGLVASMRRPSGNVTGVTALGQALNVKCLEIIKEALPGVTRVAVLANSGSPYTRQFLAERDDAARALGLQVRVHEVRDLAFDRAFPAIRTDRSEALMVLPDATLITHRRQIVELAARSRLPAVYGEREFVDAGGLMFNGASLADMYKHAAVYADKILKGAKPADLPIEQPTKLELGVKTARTLGLTIPPAVLARADHVVGVTADPRRPPHWRLRWRRSSTWRLRPIGPDWTRARCGSSPCSNTTTACASASG